MTKWGGCAFGPRGHHRADFPRAVGNDDAINEPCDPWSALSKGQRGHGGVDALAKRLDPVGQGGHIHLLLRLHSKLAQLLGPTMLGGGHLLSFAFQCVAADAFGQIDCQPPGLLALPRGQRLPERAPPRVEDLGKPFTPWARCKAYVSSVGSISTRQSACHPRASSASAGA
jgi:hypothetical protein